MERHTHMVHACKGYPMDVFAVLGRSYAPHPGAVSTYTVLGDTLGCNPGTTATLHGAPLRRGHGVKVKVGTPMRYPSTGLEIELELDE